MSATTRESSHRARAVAASIVELGRTHVRPRRERILQPRVVDGAGRGVVGGGPLRLELFGWLVEAKQRRQCQAGEVAIVLRGAPNDVGARGVRSRRPRVEIADIASAQPCVGDVGEAPCERGVLGRQRQAAIGGDGVGMRGPDLRDEGQRIPHQPFADRLGVQPRRVDARRTLNQRVEWILHRELELLGPERKEQREDRIAQQSGFDEIGAGKAQVGERRLK